MKETFTQIPRFYSTKAARNPNTSPQVLGSTIHLTEQLPYLLILQTSCQPHQEAAPGVILNSRKSYASSVISWWSTVMLCLDNSGTSSSFFLKQVIITLKSPISMAQGTSESHKSPLAPNSFPNLWAWHPHRALLKVYCQYLELILHSRDNLPVYNPVH